MCDDLTMLLPDRDQLRQWLSELRAASEDFEDFIAVQFDRLESLGAQIDERARDIDEQRAELRQQLSSLDASQKHLDESNRLAEQCALRLQDLVENLAAEAVPGLKEQIAGIEADRVRLLAGYEETKTGAQQLAQNVTAELSQARAELIHASENLALQQQRIADTETSLAATLAEHQSALARHAAAADRHVEPNQTAEFSPAPEAEDDKPLDVRMTQIRDEHPPGTKPRTPTPPPPEELPETDADTRTAWWGELQRLRAPADKAAGKGAKRPAMKHRGGQEPDETVATGTQDPVLDSVLAQFELLQKDLVTARPTPRGTAS